jgi:hypothetical protein
MKNPRWFKTCLKICVALFIAELTARMVLSFEFVQNKLFTTNTYAMKVGWVYKRPDLQSFRISIDVFDSLIGWSAKPGCFKTPYSQGTYSSDEYGVRVNPHHKVAEDSNTIRIMTVGDSFTFGEEESDENTYPAQLEMTLSNCKVYNIGVHGYGIDQMLLRLRQHVRRVKPHIVVFSFIAEDVDRATSPFTNYVKPAFVQQAGKWELKNYPVIQPEEIVKEYRFHSKLVMLGCLLANEVLHFEEEETYCLDNEQRLSLFEMILRTANAEIASAGAIPVFCLIPYPTSYTYDYSRQSHIYWQRMTDSLCAQITPYYFPLDSCFEKKVDIHHLPRKHGHWLKKENRFVAECIAGYLNQTVFPVLKKKETQATTN